MPAPSLIHVDGGNLSSRDAGHDGAPVLREHVGRFGSHECRLCNNDAELIVDAPSGVFNSSYNASWNASGINPAFLPVFPDLADDTYATVGLTGPASSSGMSGAADPSVVEDSTQPITPFFLTDGATELLSNTLTGSSWYVLNTASNGAAGAEQRVLVMQVTSAGDVSGQLNYQVFPLGEGSDAITVQVAFDGVGVFGGVEEVALCGCTDVAAANYDPESQYDDGSCVYDVLGCDDPVACNYDSTATLNDGSCDYTSCVVLGCLDPEADNYDPNATDDDGVCEYLGCTDEDAPNWDAGANVDDGSCTYPDPSFVGLTVEAVSSGFPTEAHTTYRVYVNLSNPLDQLSAVYGDSNAPMSMAVGTALYQAEGGATLAPDLPVGNDSAEIQADSWLTQIWTAGGVMLSTAGLGVPGDLVRQSGGEFSAGGVWFVLPDMEERHSPMQRPGARGAVHHRRVCVLDAEHPVFGPKRRILHPRTARGVLPRRNARVHGRKRMQLRCGCRGGRWFVRL